MRSAADHANAGAVRDSPAPVTASSAHPTKVVARPTPQAQTADARAYHIRQLQRRFPSVIAENDDSSLLTFTMKPSDPDFPFDLDQLECVLAVPKSYPAARPTLKVTNQEIPRSSQVNVERAFDTLASRDGNAALLTLMNRLDRQLETLLAGRQVDTITIVPNRPTQSRVSPSTSAVPSAPHPLPSPQPVHVPTVEEQVAARARRQIHLRQLEARFGRLPAFAKSSDGASCTLPLDSPKRASWPSSLQDVRTVELLIPETYPLDAATIRIPAEGEEARAIEKAFKSLPTQLNEPTLTQLVNHLTYHFAQMARVVEVEKPSIEPQAQSVAIRQEVPPPNTDRPHVQIIARPPEWLQKDVEDTESGSEDSSTDDENDVDEDQSPESGPANAAASAPAERGVLLSFPHLELHGIELLQLVSLDITVKCERCKDVLDVHRLRNYSGDASAMRQETCKKCASIFSLGLRADLIHQNSVRAGYLDLEGCTVIDMLPSQFVPTCAECSTAFPAPGVVAVRGDSSFAICRECHHKMTFRISEVKFLRITASTGAHCMANDPTAKVDFTDGLYPKYERVKLCLGRRFKRISASQQAQNCLAEEDAHSMRSYRWFRFSCCNKVFSCDRCHDEASDHPNEHANRMICGFCSREPNFRPEDCGICHAVLVGKRGHGFWEGGKGTRDPARMSRKDPRKYKRRPGSGKAKT